MTIEELIAFAQRAGARVYFLPLTGLNGALSIEGDILINSRLTQAAQRVTLAHELGHLAKGHDWSMEHDKARDERQADLYAARLLIDAQAYAAAENLFEGCVGSIAKELGVTRRLVELWRENHFPA